MTKQERNQADNNFRISMINERNEIACNWHQYHSLIEDLAILIDDKNLHFDQIIAIARGGLRVGDILSRIFDKPLIVLAAKSYDNKSKGVVKIGIELAHTCDEIGSNLLLVDDLVDSGETLSVATTWLEKEYGRCQVKTGVIWRKKDSIFNPSLSALCLKFNPWITQPFEFWHNKQIKHLRAMR